MAAARSGDCFICDRGGHFHVVKVWIENAWLAQVLPPVFTEEYREFAGKAARMADPSRALSAHQPQAQTLERV